MSHTEERIRAALRDGPKHLNELVTASGDTVETVCRVLLTLEMFREARRLPGDRFELAGSKK